MITTYGGADFKVAHKLKVIHALRGTIGDIKYTHVVFFFNLGPRSTPKVSRSNSQYELDNIHGLYRGKGVSSNLGSHVCKSSLFIG